MTDTGYICTDWNARNGELCGKPAEWSIAIHAGHAHNFLHRCARHARRFKTMKKYVIHMEEI